MRTLNWRVLKTYILHIIFTYFRCSIPKLCLKFASVNPQLFVDQAFLRKHRPKWRITLLPTLRPKMFNPFPEFPEYSGETLLSTEESGKKMVCKFGVVRCNMNKCIYPKTARAWRIFLHIYIYIYYRCTLYIYSWKYMKKTHIFSWYFKMNLVSEALHQWGQDRLWWWLCQEALPDDPEDEMMTRCMRNW